VTENECQARCFIVSPSAPNPYMRPLFRFVSTQRLRLESERSCVVLAVEVWEFMYSFHLFICSSYKTQKLTINIYRLGDTINFQHKI